MTDWRSSDCILYKYLKGSGKSSEQGKIKVDGRAREGNGSRCQGRWEAAGVDASRWEQMGND
jgi:hypothetical protein